MKFVYKTQIRKILFSKVYSLFILCAKKAKISYFYDKFEKSVSTHFLQDCGFENCVITQNFNLRKNFP